VPSASFLEPSDGGSRGHFSNPPDENSPPDGLEDGAPELYLTVFDHNERAKRFYTRHGFVDVGQCTFRIGDRIDDDRVWRRRLTGDRASAHAA